METSKLTLYSDLKEPYAKYGLNHCLLKYGLVPATHDKNPDIYLGYTLPADCTARVQIVLQPAVENKVTFLAANGETVPLFIKPGTQSGGRVVGKGLDGNNEYPCLSIAGNKIKIGFDIFTEIGRVLSGYYDDYFLQQGALGTALRAIPIVDVYEELLFSAINTILPAPANRFTWPDNYKFALVVTHDIDRVYKTYQYLPSLLNSLKRVNLAEFGLHLKNLLFNHGESNPYWTFDYLCHLEDELGIKSTFYFLNQKGKFNPLSLRSWILYRGFYDLESPEIKTIITKLMKDGFEIGLHGSYHSYNDKELLQSEKNILESITGSRIKGVRQHYLNYDTGITCTLHSGCGFEYDTSVGFKPENGVGFRRGTSFPFPVMLPDLTISPLWEIPLIIMDGALEKGTIPSECHKLIDQVERFGGVLTILWHNNRLNKLEYPGFTESFIDIVNQAKLRGAWVATASQVSDWIKKSSADMSVNL